MLKQSLTAVVHFIDPFSTMLTHELVCVWQIQAEENSIQQMHPGPTKIVFPT
jgi:hypothetical protein